MENVLICRQHSLITPPAYPHHIIIDCSGFNYVDTMGVHILQQVSTFSFTVFSKPTIFLMLCRFIKSWKTLEFGFSSLLVTRPFLNRLCVWGFIRKFLKNDCICRWMTQYTLLMNLISHQLLFRQNWCYLFT